MSQGQSQSNEVVLHNQIKKNGTFQRFSDAFIVFTFASGINEKVLLIIVFI